MLSRYRLAKLAWIDRGRWGVDAEPVAGFLPVPTAGSRVGRRCAARYGLPCAGALNAAGWRDPPSQPGRAAVAPGPTSSSRERDLEAFRGAAQTPALINDALGQLQPPTRVRKALGVGHEDLRAWNWTLAKPPLPRSLFGYDLRVVPSDRQSCKRHEHLGAA